MAYKLEHSNDEQRSLLSSTVEKWSNCQPDMYIISKEGHKIYTQRILLGLYSDFIDELLSTPGLGDLPGISVPASSGCLVNLLKILATGVAIANNKASLLEASKAAKAIGIKLANCQIGVKKSKVAKPVAAKNEVQVNQTSSKDKKRKAETDEHLSKKPKIDKRVPINEVVKPEVEEQDDFMEGYADGDVKVEDKSESQEKVSPKHPCSQCGKDFSSNRALNRHFLIHTDNPKPFACDHCEKKFDRKYRLEKHMKTAHNDIPKLDADINDDGNKFDQTTLAKSQEAEEEGKVDIEDDKNEFDKDGVEDQTTPVEFQKVEEEGEAVPEKGLVNIELDENAILGDDDMELDEIETPAEKEELNVVPDVIDSLAKDHEKLLSDRKKLLAELSDIEGDSHGDLDFLNVD